MQGIGRNDDISELLRHTKKIRSVRRHWRGRRRARRGGGSLSSQNLEHDRAAGRAFAFDGFPTVLHRFLNGLSDLFFRFALNAITFGHKKPGVRFDPCAVYPYSLRVVRESRQLGKPNGGFES